MTYEDIKTLLNDSPTELADQALAGLASARNTRRNHEMVKAGKRGAAALNKATAPAEEWVAARITAYLEDPAPFDFRHHLDSPTYADCWSVARAIETIRAA